MESTTAQSMFWKVICEKFSFSNLFPFDFDKMVVKQEVLCCEPGSFRMWTGSVLAHWRGNVDARTGTRGACCCVVSLPAASAPVSRTKAEIKARHLLWSGAAARRPCWRPESCSIMAVAIETVHPVGWVCRADVMVIDGRQDHSWTWTVCVRVCVCYIVRAKFIQFFFCLFCFYKQAGISDNLWLYLISNNSINVTEPLHVQLIKIKKSFQWYSHAQITQNHKMAPSACQWRAVLGWKCSHVVCIQV